MEEALENINTVLLVMLVSVALYVGWGWLDDRRWDGVPLPAHLFDSHLIGVVTPEHLLIPIPTKDVVK